MYLLDTTHCLRLFWGVLEEKLKSFDKIQLSTNVIARGELIYGIHKSERFYENFIKFESFLKDIKVYPIDDDTANSYGKLKNEIVGVFGPKDKSKLRNFKVDSLGFKENDLWISASAIQHNLILVSADKHIHQLQGINGLKVESW